MYLKLNSKSDVKSQQNYVDIVGICLTNGTMTNNLMNIWFPTTTVRVHCLLVVLVS